MLSIWRFRNPEERQTFIEQFDPTEMTWLVSDLRSKFALQNLVMQKLGFFEDQMVMRASELWSLVSRKFQPEQKIVSRDFIKSWLREQWDLSGQPKQPGSEEILLELMDDFAQAISHPNGFELIVDWLEQNSSARERWGDWFVKAYDSGLKMLKQNRANARWIAPALTNADIMWTQYWKRPLIVDLGPELSRAEAELIVQISKEIPIQVLCPQLDDSTRFKYLLSPYEWLMQQSQDLHDAKAGKIKTSGSRQSVRLTSPLAEVKYVVSKVREALDDGAQPQNIAVIAPDIEDYWPLLEIYFREEGVPVAKDSTFRVSALNAIQKWLARLRVAQRSFEYVDLESVTYNSLQQIQVRFEKFEALFKNLLDPQDLLRDPEVVKMFEGDGIPTGPISRKQLIAVLLKYWPADCPHEQLESILREIVETAEENISMHFQNWFYWLEHIVNRLEVRWKLGDRQGVQVVNLLAADSADFTHRFFLGLTESNFKNKRKSFQSPSEIEKLYLDTGFHCYHPEQSSLDFELRWLSGRRNTQDHFLFPMTSAGGSIEAPQVLWVELAEGKEIFTTVPGLTRFDEIQIQKDLSSIGEVRGWEKPQLQAIQDQSDRDRSISAPGLIPLSAPDKLSVTLLEMYFDCPFKFAAARIFRLEDESELDLDADARSQGKIVHHMLEVLTTEPRRYDWTQDEIRTLIEQQRAQIRLGDSQLWPPLRDKIVRLGQRFLEFEKKNMKPKIKSTLAVEKRFQVSHHGVEWTGSMDRLDDIGDGKLVLYDYKPRNSKYSVSQWQKENHLQVAFYAWLLQDKKIKGLEDYDLAGAFYYVYRDFSLVGAQADQDKFATVQENMKWASEQVEKFTEALKVGEFPPKPRDESLCSYCKWSQLCRAPHLMS